MTPARRPEAAKRWLEEARERLDHARTYHGGSRRILCEQAHYASDYAIKSVIIAVPRSNARHASWSTGRSKTTSKPPAGINIDRIKARVADCTAHDVPNSEVRQRWTAAQENLVRTSNAINDIQLIDNSQGRARRIATIPGSNGQGLHGTLQVGRRI